MVTCEQEYAKSVKEGAGGICLRLPLCVMELFVSQAM